MLFSWQAVLRITQRDGVTTEDALRRLQSQWPNSRQVEHANVVLSTLWEPEVTRKQVRPASTCRRLVSPNKNVGLCDPLCCPFTLKVLKAWNLLQDRIQPKQEGNRTVRVTTLSQL